MLGPDDAGGQQRVRLIHILRAEKSCLTCHAVQGYREGEVIGGLSVSPPLAEMAHMQEVLSGKITLLHVLRPVLHSGRGLVQHAAAAAR